jgi:hypothetical protein
MAAITRNAPIPTPAPTASAVLLFCGAGAELSVDSSCVDVGETAEELVVEVVKTDDVVELSLLEVDELVNDVSNVKDVALVSLDVVVVGVEEVELEELSLSSAWIQN